MRSHETTSLAVRPRPSTPADVRLASAHRHPRTSFALGALLSVLLSACAGSEAVRRAEPEPPIQLALEGATVEELARAIADAGVPVVIDAPASMLAGCVRVSLHTGGPVAPERAFGLVARALDQSGLAIARSGDGWAIGLADQAVMSRSCAAHLARVLLGADLETLAGIGEPADRLAADDPNGDLAERPASPSELDLDDAITRVSEREVRVRRDALEAVLADPRALDARVVPHAGPDGQVSRVRLAGIRPASLLDRLGFANGDIVIDVAGHSVATPDGALEAYARLRRAEEIPVQVERQGELFVQTIRVVSEPPSR